MPMLTHQFVLEAPSDLADGGGGVARSWSALGLLWGRLAPVSAREPVIGLRQGQRISHRVTVPSAPPGSPRRPRPSQRLRRGSRIFDILAVAEADATGAELTLWVTEGALA